MAYGQNAPSCDPLIGYLKINICKLITLLDHITIVTQRQLMRLFAVKLILSYEQKCKVRSKFLKN